MGRSPIETDPVRAQARRRIAKDARRDYVKIGTKVPRGLKEELFGILREEGVSFGMLVEAFIRGYVERSPSILALIDQHFRERERSLDVTRIRRPKVFSGNELAAIRRELDEISAFGGGEEGTDVACTEDQED